MSLSRLSSIPLYIHQLCINRVKITYLVNTISFESHRSEAFGYKIMLDGLFARKARSYDGDEHDRLKILGVDGMRGDQ